MSIGFNDTRTMLAALERTKAPSTLLRDTFFPNVQTFPTRMVDIEYRKGGTPLAPFVVKGTGGVNMARAGSEMRSYEPPMSAPKRPISVEHIEQRAFGEPVYSTQTPEQRAAALRAKDLEELRDMNTRLMEWMCAQLLITGSFAAKGYSDDGKTYLVNTLTLDWTQKMTLTGEDTWNNPGADIYGNLQDASRIVSEASGMVPAVAIGDFNVIKYLIGNASMQNWLLRPKENLSLMSISPRIQSPEVIRVGIVESLNLEIYAYNATYTDHAGVTQKYIPSDHIIIGVPGRGKQLFGAVTQLEQDGVWRTYQGANVPKVWSDVGSDVQEIRVASKGIPLPEFVDDWYTYKVK